MEYSGKTALITGASSGIGKAFAAEFAAQGANVVMVAWHKEGLVAAAKEIAEQHKVKTYPIALDLGQEGAPQAIFQSVQKSKLQVDILVNAAGFGTRGQYHALAADTEHQQIMVNSVAMASLTRLFMPGMMLRNYGVIINLGSNSGSFWPGPYMATYGATKAFNVSFTEALWGECRGTGVKVLALCPGPTATNFHHAHGFSSQGTSSPAATKEPTMRKPEQVVATAFRALKRGKPVAIDGISSYLQAMMPRFITTKLATRLAGNTIRPNKLR